MVDVDLIPSYDRPPVIEALIAIEFVAIPALGAISLAGFHNMIKAQYPNTLEFIASTNFGPAIVIPGAVNQTPGIRLWMADHKDEFLVQLQFDRLILNWRQRDGSPYPRFDSMMNRFGTVWQEFLDYVTGAMGQSPVVPLVAEVTYVNRVPLSEDLDVGSVLSLLNAEARRTVDSLSLAMRFSVLGYEPGGSVEVIAEKLPADGGPESFGFNVSARLSVEGSALRAVPRALHAAHRAAVVEFTRSTDGVLHRLWGRTQ